MQKGYTIIEKVQTKKPIKTGKVSNRDLAKALLANNIPDTEERTHQL